MNYQERERFLYKILSGNTFVNVNSKIFLIKSPDVDDINESNFVYDEVYAKSIKEGSFSKAALETLLLEKNLFSLDDLAFISSFSTKLEKLQLQLYYNRDNVQKFKTITDNLKILRKEYSRRYSLVSLYDGYTAEGLASYSKNIFLLTKTVYYNKKIIKYKKTLFEKILFELNEHQFSQTEIREIARSTPWSNMWIGLKNNGLIFKTGVSISLEQQMLLMWTRIYDSLQEATEPPEDSVIGNDDLLDGWMLSQKDDKKEKESNHDEIFVIAETDEDIDRINNMNSPQAKNIKNQRLNYIYEVGAEVDEKNLPDVRQEIGMKLVNMERNTRRGLQ